MAQDQIEERPKRRRRTGDGDLKYLEPLPLVPSGLVPSPLQNLPVYYSPFEAAPQDLLLVEGNEQPVSGLDEAAAPLLPSLEEMRDRMRMLQQKHAAIRDSLLE
eukprot:jgi/Mesen1/2343/ME000155S01425